MRTKFIRWVAGWLMAGILAGAASAAEAEGNPRDTLVYKDGDRVQGTLLRRDAGMLVFKSDRFGELRVAATDAVVIAGEKAAEATVAEATAAPKPAATPAAATAEKVAVKAKEAKVAAQTEAERVSLWERFSPWQLTAKVREFFGPWHGRFAFSTELVSDTADRNNIALEGHLQRKWKRDEVQLNARYDYSDTNQLTTTDTVRGDGSWRHDFLKGRFAQYRPTVEWNRANFRSGIPSDYVLLQQEIGAGYTLLSTDARKVRLGVSENLFDTWTFGPAATHNSRVAESMFVEAELKLPWRMTMSERAVGYNPFTNQRYAWENRVDLTKKLTETLSVSVRHEIRKNNPDGSAQDYQRLRLLLGLDF